MVAAGGRLCRGRAVHRSGIDDPFAPTEAERQRNADPRPSLEARYSSREAWATQLAAATERLVAERLLLQEDAEWLIAAAHESWDVYRVL